MASKLVDLVYSRLLQVNYQYKLFKDLEGFKPTGRGYIACCPYHDDQNPSFQIYGDRPGFHCYSCGVKGDWITYLRDHKGLDFLGSLKFLADEANIDVSRHFIRQDEYKSVYSKRMVLESILDVSRDNLLGNTDVVDYLKRRGFNENQFADSEFGVYPEPSVLLRMLKNSYSDQELVESGVCRKDESGKIVVNDTRLGTTHLLSIPFKSVSGLVNGFIVRTIKDHDPKYLYTKGLDLSCPFNLYKVRHAREIIITEGSLDCLSLVSNGVSNVISIGGKNLTDKHVDYLKETRIQTIILCLDPDEPGRTGTEKAIRLLIDHGYTVFVGGLPEGQDVNDYVRRNGIDRFKELVDQSIKGVKWICNRVISQHDLDTDLGKQRCFEGLVELEKSMIRIGDVNEVRTMIRNSLNIPDTVIDEYLQSIRDREQKLKLERDVNRLIYDNQHLLKDHKVSEYIEHVSNGLDTIKSEQVNVIQPISCWYAIDDLRMELNDTVDSLKTGYKNLDRYISIQPEAITLVVGRPGHGKTTFLMNLFLNMVNQYQNKSFFFFTYEETRRQIVSKLISIISNQSIRRFSNIKAIEQCIKSGEYQDERGQMIQIPATITNAIKKYQEYTVSKRLGVVSEPYRVDQLCGYIHDLNNQHNVGGVFIDYIQKIPGSGRHDVRYLELKQISDSLLNTAKKSGCPIILGAQVGRDTGTKKTYHKIRLDNLRESGDLEQDANTVLGVLNHGQSKCEEKQDDQNELDISPMNNQVDFTVSVLKNRNGQSNVKSEMVFNSPTLRIIEKVNP